MVSHDTVTKRSPLKYGASDHLQGSIMFLLDGVGSIGALDTMAQVGICNETMIPTEATIVIDDDGTEVIGLGGKVTKAGRLYSIKMLMRPGSCPVVFNF
jgi:hypothetical protein